MKKITTERNTYLDHVYERNATMLTHMVTWISVIILFLYLIGLVESLASANLSVIVLIMQVIAFHIAIAACVYNKGWIIKIGRAFNIIKDLVFISMLISTLL